MNKCVIADWDKSEGKKPILRRLFNKRTLARLKESCTAVSWTWLFIQALTLSRTQLEMREHTEGSSRSNSTYNSLKTKWCGILGTEREVAGPNCGHRSVIKEDQAHRVKMKTICGVNMLLYSPYCVTLLPFVGSCPTLRSHYGAFCTSIWMIHSFYFQFTKYACLILLSSYGLWSLP